MAKQTPPKRKYDSSRRKEQARQTRLRITEAARSLFSEYGYAGATIDAIAQEAGVAKETVYGMFKNKRNVLSFLLDISLGGDDQPVSILDRPEPQAVMKDTDQRRQLEMFSKGITEVMSHAAPVFEIMQNAAKTEPEIAEHVKRLFEERLQNMLKFVRSVAVNGGLRDDLNETYAAETVWALTSPDLFSLLTGRLGWSKEKYVGWLFDALQRLLLP